MLIEEAAIKFKETLGKEGIIRIVTHLDTDGLSSAAILIKALRKLDQQFSVRTLKQLEDNVIEKLFIEIKKQKCKAVFFLDLGSNKIEKILSLANFCQVIILDHHEIPNREFLDYIKDNPNILFVNPEIESNEKGGKISASSIVYTFIKKLDDNKDLLSLSQLAILGMIGDMVDKEVGKLNKTILEDAKTTGMQTKKGPIVFSATRPIHKSLELNSSIFIPGVTGSQNGAIAFLRDLDIPFRTEKNYRTLLDLNEHEMSKLLTAIILARMESSKSQDVIGNIYLIKFNGYLMDARELSTMINACGRLGYSSLALSFLLGSKRAKEKIEYVYSKYRHHILNGLNYVNIIEKIQGKNYMIVNAKDKIKDTIIGTVISILASSCVYPQGKILVGMAYRRDKKIKVSARISGRENTEYNLCKLLESVVADIKDCEVGGHPNAAGCLIRQRDEPNFIKKLQQSLEIEEIKIAI
jgi:single-stranded-DNA-specific exonuclease